MPKVTAWIDDLRAAFGADEINAIIKAGVGGMPGFCASEGGHSVGTPAGRRGTEFSAADIVIHRLPKEEPNAPRR